MAKENKVEQQQVSPETQQVDPKVQREIEAYISGLSKMLHGKETRNQVLSMLKSAEPQIAIPQTALTVNMQMEQAISSKGKKPSLDVLAAAAQFLVGDLLEIGNAAGIFNIQDEQQIGAILTDTMQQYIEKGLKDGSIDPIELQQKAEPLMDEEHRALGMEAAKRTGIPLEPDQNTAMQAYGRKMEMKGMLKGGKQGMVRGGK